MSTPRLEIHTSIKFILAIDGTLTNIEDLDHQISTHRDNVWNFLKHATKMHNEDSESVELLGKVLDYLGEMALEPSQVASYKT